MQFVSIHRLHPFSHEGYLLIARTAFGHDQNNVIHSPITLKGQRCEVVLSSRLKVYSNYISMQSASVHSDGSECGELIAPSSPTLYYHPVVSPTDQKVVGVISGLPCSLDFSTSSSNLCDVSSWTDGTGSTISINTKHFFPGSVVIYRTSLTESVVATSTCKYDSMASPSLLLPSEKVSGGYVQQLWNLFGFSNRIQALKTLTKIVPDSSLGFNLCFSDYNDSLWPNELKECIEDLEIEDINILLFRSSNEETDTIGIFYI